MREELFIDLEREIRCIKLLAEALKLRGHNASNSIVVTVSTDYSSIAGQIIRHELTHAGEIADGFGVDVPYPDQVWDDAFEKEFIDNFKIHSNSIKGKTLILVEAGVIRGGNYQKSIELIRKRMSIDNPIVLTSLFENMHSVTKSDLVVEYYDDTREDLTFWWEKENNHWK